MVEQTKKVIAIFNEAFPRDIGVLAFDKSSGHACKAKDALRMNLRPGGKQPAMHSTKWVVFLDGDKDWDTDTPILPELVGKPKGMKTVLQERGRKKKDNSNSNFEERLFQETMEQYQSWVADRCETGKNCCALRILEAQDAFKNDVSLLETVTRENCKYSISKLEPTVLQAMDSVKLNIKTTRLQ